MLRLSVHFAILGGTATQKSWNISNFAGRVASGGAIPIQTAAIPQHGRTPAKPAFVPVKLGFDLVFFVGLPWLQCHSFLPWIHRGGFLRRLVPPGHPVEKAPGLGGSPAGLALAFSTALMRLRKILEGQRTFWRPGGP
jgi:hypothetical protein